MSDTEAYRNLAPELPRLSVVVFFIGALLTLLGVLWPRSDLLVAGWFYQPSQGFFLENILAFVVIHWLAYYGARALALFFIAGILLSIVRKKPFFNVTTKGWLFLFLGLMLAPGLVGNALFKDHWGRARPHEVTQFGGKEQFSPALLPQPDAHRNSSFVSGDGSFGFYLPCVAYIIPPGPNSRRRAFVFWGGLALGAVFGFTRIVMGAHFLSDVMFSGLFSLMTMAALHAGMFGANATRERWREWMGRERGPRLPV